MRRLPFVLAACGALGALGWAGVAGAASEVASEVASSPPGLLAACPSLQGWVETPGGWLYGGWELAPPYRLTMVQVDAFERLIRAFGDNGITLVVALLPTRPTADPSLVGSPTWPQADVLAQYRAALRWIERNGALTVDIVDEAAALHDRGDEGFYLRHDDHWTPNGARVTAIEVRRVLEGTPAFAQLPHRAYVTTPADIVRTTTGASRRCAALPPVSVQHFVTRPAREPSLLEDVPPPDVVLLGSSMSTPDLNFGGFLQEQLSADVLTVAVPGGQALSALMTWLGSPDYQARRPRIVVWELELAHLFGQSRPGVPDPRDASVYREIVPALYGDCPDDALLRAEGDAGAGLVLENRRRAPLSGSEHYLSVSLDADADLEVTVEYTGAIDRVTTRRDSRVTTAGRRYLELSPDISAPLERIRVRTKAPGAAPARVHLCRKGDAPAP